MNKKLFSTAARRIAALLLLLCLSATTTWALRITCVTEPSNLKGGKAAMYDLLNYPQRVRVRPNPGFEVKKVLWEKKENGVVTSHRTLKKKGVKESTRDEYYDVPEVTGCYLTVTFHQLSDNVEVNFDMNGLGSPEPVTLNLHIDDLVPEPTAPTDINFNFLGWFTDEKFKTPFNFNNALDYSLPFEVDNEKLVLNLYAKWESKWDWKFATTENKDLCIIGPGPMDDYKSGKTPWYKQRNTINTINIGDGVTHIGNYAFKDLKDVKTDVTIPASVKTIGHSAFTNLSASGSVINITIPTGSQLDSIDKYAFKSAQAYIDLSNSTLLTKIDNSVFTSVGGNVILPASVDTIVPKAFSKFEGYHVYIPVPEGKALTVNGSAYSGGMTDGKADIISYLFKNTSKRGSSLAVKIKMVSLSDYDNVTVKFNANGYGTAPAWVNTTIGQTITQPTALTADGYTFLGWYKDAAGTKAFDFSTVLSRDGLAFSGADECFILPLYAKWQKNSCTVTFNGNGATEGTMAAVTHDGGTSYSIPACGFTYTGHSFLGWATSADGSVEYQPNDVINPLLNDLTLYAVWDYELTGSCGTNLTWTLTSSAANGKYDKLTISGSGAMTDYETMFNTPWYNHRATIKTLIMGEGVTHIGKNAFNDLSEITSDITIPANVKSIGKDAFTYISTSENNPGVSIATATGSQLTSIEEDAFYGANAYIDLSNSPLLATIAKFVFRNAKKDVTLSASVTLITANAFCGFTGDYVYIPVVEKKYLMVNKIVYDDAILNEDRLVEIIGYLFGNLSNRRSNKKITLAQMLNPDAKLKVTTDGHSEAYYKEEADDEDETPEIKKITEDTDVHPGATVWLSWGGENLEEGTYVSGFTVTKAGGGTVEVKPNDDNKDYFFVMPEDDVTVTTHTAPRETFTLDLTSVTVEDTIVINEMVYILMQTLQGYLHAEEDIETGRFKQCYDVNFDGKYDFELTSPAGEEDVVDPDDDYAYDYAYDYTVTPLAGASEVTTNYLFTPNYPFPYQYNKILVKFKDSEARVNQIKFDDLYDSSNLNFDIVCNWSNTTRNLIIGGRKLFRDGDWNTICLPFDLTLAGSSFDFGEDVENEEKNLEARQLIAASITDKTLNLTFSEPVSILEAGVPYIIKWAVAPQNIEDPIFLNATIANVAACAGSSNEEKVAAFLTNKGYDNGVAGEDRVRFTGTFGWTRFDKTDTSILLLGAANKLYYPEPVYDPESGVVATPELGAFRAYFKIGEDGAASAREITDFNITFDEQGTQNGIGHTEITEITEKAAAAWYDLQGRKLNAKPTQKGLHIYKGKKVVIK
ncbi:InlB B-repeat-containing protein [uncultured Prevotella sp.]|uniref:InlB B-repeat-containing protein n=1 Tax=uncultured Prevotella sp. TaxID=159272 RepID=UPI0025FA3A0B|nr:InlB B-repeat-containing protein [uncultured Prevotella sp.]